MTSTTTAPEQVEVEAPERTWSGQNVPRKEDRRLVQGQGVFVDGDATPEQLAALVEQSRRRSAVYDVLTSGTDVVIDVNAA